MTTAPIGSAWHARGGRAGGLRLNVNVKIGFHRPGLALPTSGKLVLHTRTNDPGAKGKVTVDILVLVTEKVLCQ